MIPERRQARVSTTNGQQFGSWTTIRTVTPDQRFQTVYGLAANTSYSFAVIAFDARGNTSARSDPGTVTTLPYTATPTCKFQIIPFPRGFSRAACEQI